MKACGLVNYGNKGLKIKQNYQTNACRKLSFFNQTLQKTTSKSFHTTSQTLEYYNIKPTQTEKEKVVVVLGGGISGISFAYYLLRESLETNKKVKVVLLERNKRLGGWIKTRRTQYGVIEAGARNLYSYQSLNLLKIIQDVGLNDQLVAAEPLQIYQHFLMDRKYKRVPHSLVELLRTPLLSKFQKWYVYFKQSLLSYKFKDDASIYDFFAKQTSKTFTETIVVPLCASRFFGDAKKLSMKAHFKEVWELTNEHGSIFRGLQQRELQKEGDKIGNRFARTKRIQAIALKNYMLEYAEASEEERKTLRFSDYIAESEEAVRPLKRHPMHKRIAKSSVFTLKNGLSSLPERMIQYLLENFPDQFEIHYPQTATSIIQNDEDQNIIVTTINKNGEESAFMCDYVVSACSSFELAKMVEGHNRKLAMLLNDIKFAPVGVVNVAYDQLIQPPIMGSGYIIPPNQNHFILETHFDSQIYKEQYGSDLYSKFTMIFGGDQYNDTHYRFLNFVNNSEMKEYQGVIKKVIKDQLGIDREIPLFYMDLYPRTVPQYYLGHRELVEAIQSHLKKSYVIDNKPRLFVIGKSYFGSTINQLVNDTKLRAIDFAAQL